MARTHREHLLDLARRKGVVTTRDVDVAGIHRQTLTRLVRDGVLERIERFARVCRVDRVMRPYLESLVA